MTATENRVRQLPHLAPLLMLLTAAVVPTGNGELIIRQAEGWALVHP